MANYHEALATAATPEQRAAWEKQLAYAQQQNGTRIAPAPVRAELKVGVLQHDAGNSGAGAGFGKAHGKGTAYATDGLRPGHVIINGIETTAEVARKAGFDVGSTAEGEQRRPFGGDTFPTIQPHGIRPSGVQSGGVQPNHAPKPVRGVEQQPAYTPDSTMQESREGQQDGTEGQTPQEVAKAASEALQSIERAHGVEAVDAGLGDVSDSGYLPDEDQLPQGVTMAAVEKIVAGYTAQANDALSGVGASVDMLMETLSDDDLREARRATIMGDSTKLQRLGARAVDALAALPTADPEAFAEMVEGMTAPERKALSRAENGDWIVTLPGYPQMGFAAAVKAGIVRV